MSYIQESLSDSEAVLHVFEPHWMVRALVIGNFALAAITLGLWLPVALYVWLKWRATEQAVTNKRVIHKSGIVSLTTDEMRLRSIEAIHVEQSVLGRMFGYGVVVVTGRGTGTVNLRWMSDPLEVKRQIENAEQTSMKWPEAGDSR